MDGSNGVNNINNNQTTTTINTIDKFIDRYKSDDLNLYINGEFLELKELTNDIKRNKTHTTNHGCLDCNKYKNRYKDILPYDDTRVILDRIDSIDGSDYINANYLFGVSQSYSYIGAQAPLSTTVFDFMRMFLQLNINTVICACNEYEGLKLKCYRYWPLDKDDVLEFDNKLSRIQVRLHSIEYSSNNDYIIRKLLIKYKQINGNNGGLSGSKEHLLTQIHITSWPDHGVLQSIETIVKLLDLAHDNLQINNNKQQQQQSSSSYLCVHCSAGCGRTGTIIAIDYCYNLVYLNKLNNDFHPVKIAKLLREQRMTMIQTIEQYQMFYDSLFYIFDKYLKENSKSSANNRASSSSSSTNNLCFNNNIYFNKSELFNNNDEYANNNNNDDDADDDGDGEDADGIDTNLREIKSPKLKESRKTRKSKKIKDGIMNKLRRFKAQKPTTSNDGSHTNRQNNKKYDLNNNRIDGGGDDDSSRFDSSNKCNNYPDSDEDVSANGAYGDGDDTNNDSNDDYSDNESRFEFKPSTIEHLNNLKLTNDTYRSQQQAPIVSVRRQPFISINDDKYKISNNVGGAAASIFGSNSTNNNRKSVLNENSDNEETSIRSNLSISGKITEHHAKYTDLKQLNPPMKAQLVRETTFSTSVITSNDDHSADSSLKSSYRPTPPPRTKSKFKKMNSSFEFRTNTNSKIDDHQQAFNKNDLIDNNNNKHQQQRSMSANNSNRSFSVFDNQQDYN